MNAEPQAEHAWLAQLVGEWTYESECLMGPDQPPARASGRETVRPFGKLWIQSEGGGEMPGGGPMRSILTLGFDSRRKQFVGAFVADCMAMLWTYTGALDASGQQLTLEAEGPDATGEGQTKYRDIIQIIDADHRVTRSEMLMPDGQWVEYMKLEYTRQQS